MVIRLFLCLLFGHQGRRVSARDQSLSSLSVVVSYLKFFWPWPFSGTSVAPREPSPHEMFRRIASLIILVRYAYQNPGSCGESCTRAIGIAVCFNAYYLIILFFVF